MRKLQYGLMFMIVMLAAACSFHQVDGSGNVTEESRAVSGFTSVQLNGSGNMEIEQTGTDSLTIAADDNLLPLLTSEVKGSELVLDVRRFTNLNPTKKIVYKITVKDLKGISIAGSGTASARGIETDRLTISVAGQGEITTEGQARTQDINIACQGDYHAQKLKTKETSISIAGSGKSLVAASDKLAVNIVGEGSIDYVGDPAITQNIVGSGSVRKQQ